MKQTKTLQHIAIGFLLAGCFLVSNPSWGMYRFVSWSEAQAQWQILLKHRAFQSIPEARFLLQLLATQTFDLHTPKGQIVLSWFVDVQQGKLTINQSEFTSLARMYSIYADASRHPLHRLWQAHAFLYWTGGLGTPVWNRVFALKLLPGLLYAATRLRFRQEVAHRLGWSYPLESREELLAGMIVQARCIEQIQHDPDLKHLWFLVNFGRVDRPYQILMTHWSSQGIAGLHQWIKQFTAQPLGILSPLYSLSPLKDVFHISLSKKRPPFQLNRIRTDSLLLDKAVLLQKKIQQEYRMIRDYLRFIEERVPLRVAQIVQNRLKRMGIDQAEPRALWFSRLWQNQLYEHFNTNLMVENFREKQQRNHLALRLMENPRLFRKLQQIYQEVLDLWLVWGKTSKRPTPR